MDCILSPAPANTELIFGLLRGAGIEISVHHDLPDDCTLIVCDDGALADIRQQLEDYAWVTSMTKSSVENLLLQAQRGMSAIAMCGALH